MPSLDSFLQSGQDAAFKETAKVVAIAVIGLVMRFLARKDLSTKETIEFSQSRRKVHMVRWIALLRFLLLAGLFLLIPRIQTDIPEQWIPAITATAFFSAGALIAISFYTWKLDRSMARGAMLSVVMMVLGYTLICRYGD